MPGEPHWRDSPSARHRSSRAAAEQRTATCAPLTPGYCARQPILLRTPSRASSSRSSRHPRTDSSTSAPAVQKAETITQMVDVRSDRRAATRRNRAMPAAADTSASERNNPGSFGFSTHPESSAAPSSNSFRTVDNGVVNRRCRHYRVADPDNPSFRNAMSGGYVFSGASKCGTCPRPGIRCSRPLPFGTVSAMCFIRVLKHLGRAGQAVFRAPKRQRWRLDVRPVVDDRIEIRHLAEQRLHHRVAWPVGAQRPGIPNPRVFVELRFPRRRVVREISEDARVNLLIGRAKISLVGLVDAAPWPFESRIQKTDRVVDDDALGHVRDTEWQIERQACHPSSGRRSRPSRFSDAEAKDSCFAPCRESCKE